MSGHVASQTNNQPLFQWTIVTPLGLFPSVLFRPCGSKHDRIFAVVNDLYVSFTFEWR